jgi:hypothetical protein
LAARASPCPPPPPAAARLRAHGRPRTCRGIPFQYNHMKQHYIS